MVTSYERRRYCKTVTHVLIKYIVPNAISYIGAYFSNDIK